MQHLEHDGAAAPGLAADATGRKDEAPPSPHPAAPQAHIQPNTPNDTGIGAACLDPAAARQREKDNQTLIAEFALAGIELVKLADGSWLASRWGMFRSLATAEEARAWLARVKGRP